MSSLKTWVAPLARMRVLLGFLAIGLAFQGCGSDAQDGGHLPRDTAAIVGNRTIPRAAIDRELEQASGVSASREVLQDRVLEGLIFEVWLRKELRSRGMLEATIRNGTSLFDAVIDASGTSSAPVTAAEVASYYRSHRSDFDLPRGRQLRLVVTGSPARARAALRAIEGGASWSTVVNEYSTDLNTRRRSPPGSMAVLAGELPAPLDAAVFKARRHVASAPVHAGGDWYVFQVVGTTPSSRFGLHDAIVPVRHLLEGRRRVQAVRQARRMLVAKYRPRTRCAADFAVSLCADRGATR